MCSLTQEPPLVMFPKYIGLETIHTFLFKFRGTLTLTYIFKGKYGVEIEKCVYPICAFVKSCIRL